MLFQWSTLVSIQIGNNSRLFHPAGMAHQFAPLWPQSGRADRQDGSAVALGAVHRRPLVGRDVPEVRIGKILARKFEFCSLLSSPRTPIFRTPLSWHHESTKSDKKSKYLRIRIPPRRVIMPFKTSKIPMKSFNNISDQSNKQLTLVMYDSAVVLSGKLPILPIYPSILIYDRINIYNNCHWSRCCLSPVNEMTRLLLNIWPFSTKKSCPIS